MAKGKEVALWWVLVAACVLVVTAKNSSPQVRVFTRHPVEHGKENIFQCYVDRFHPPLITVTLLKNGEPMASKQSDLSFHPDWTFHQLVFADITVDQNDKYACKVEHETLPKPTVYTLEVEH